MYTRGIYSLPWVCSFAFFFTSLSFCLSPHCELKNGSNLLEPFLKFSYQHPEFYNCCDVSPTPSRDDWKLWVAWAGVLICWCAMGSDPETFVPHFSLCTDQLFLAIGHAGVRGFGYRVPCFRWALRHERSWLEWLFGRRSEHLGWEPSPPLYGNPHRVEIPDLCYKN